MADEYVAFIAMFTVIQPFERWFMGAERVRRLGRGEAPVLLVHGYGCNRGVWWRLRRRLEAAGWCVATLNLEPIYGSIDDYVEPLRVRVESVCAQTGAQQVILVSHSMGGLACRAYLARHGAKRVAKLVTLGAPHRGSLLARIGLGSNARQMEPGSPWIEALGQKGLPPGLAAVSIYSVHDNFVMPQEAQRLEGADNQPTAGVGHLALLFSRRVGDGVIAALTGNRGYAHRVAPRSPRA
jgi:triacylglycerol lipase